MIHKRQQPAQPSTKDQRIAELESELVRERANNQRLRVNNMRLEKLLERLRAEVEELQRAGQRQAAPFARHKLVAHPKSPGRKAGQGKFSRRQRPELEQVNDTKIVELEDCPQCGSELKNIRQNEQYVSDIPKIFSRSSLAM